MYDGCLELTDIMEAVRDERMTVAEGCVALNRLRLRCLMAYQAAFARE